MAQTSFSPREILRKKRDGLALTSAEIQFFIHGMTHDIISEAQMAALAMAIFFRGMTAQETSDLTLAMAHSGTVLDWEQFSLPGPIVDKHSSGGVGDKVSLMLAPMLAASGAYVPMITGRGLGHTGGTTDKLESIPDYRTNATLAEFQQVVCQIGCAIIGQTPELAPADRKLYTCRDNTETVASLPLIVSSILSKKIAAGVRALVMQVNFGNGALIPRYPEAKLLAEALVATGQVAKLPITALMTDMNQVIGYNAGHSLEVIEALDFLTGKRQEPRMYELTLALGAEVLVDSGLYPTLTEARTRLEWTLTSGAACERFAKMVAALGGPIDLIERPAHYLTAAPYQTPFYAERTGYLAEMDTRAIGLTIIGLGGGRVLAQDTIDFRVGISEMSHVGTALTPQQPIALIHSRNEAEAEWAKTELRKAITITDHPPVVHAAVQDRIKS